jgi:uncharacterized membrane protein (DUF4010 family)
LGHCRRRVTHAVAGESLERVDGHAGDLRAAFTFAALYVLVLFAVARANQHAGTRGAQHRVGVLSNLVFKGAMAPVLGDAGLRRSTLGLFGLQLVAGAALLAFWPR